MTPIAETQFMAKALALAEKGLGYTSPNPCVGAVVVKKGDIIGSGFHGYAGGPHAEIEALREAGKSASGATLYVTLEPCSHTGRTAPCTSALIDAGISKVVFSIEDPNPRSSGKAKRILEKAGIQVEIGLLAEKSRLLNQPFFKTMSEQLPFVTLKIATTLDGKIASRAGVSKWITNEHSREYVHLLRHQHDAVLVGIGTVLEDDPHLGVRFIKGEDPVRVILDSHLRIPLQTQVFRDSNVIIFTTDAADMEKKVLLESMGVRVFSLGSHVGIRDMLKKLYEENIMSVFVEGGAKTYTSFWDEGCVDRIVWFLAPKIFGDKESMAPFLSEKETPFEKLPVLEHVSVHTFEGDICMDGFLRIY